MTDQDEVEAFAFSAAASVPAVRRDPLAFAEYVRSQIVPRLDGEPLSDLHAADLFLAWACLVRDDAAWRELGRIHLARVPEWVVRIDPSPAFADEVRQRVAERMVSMGDGGDGSLAQYTGRGPLGGWIRVSVVREARAMNAAALATAPAEDPAGGMLAASGDDAELQLLKQRYAKELREAFERVLPALAPDERNLLRLHYLDGLTIEEVGRTYGVSRATAARHIAAARDRIIAEMSVALKERLGPGAPEAASMIALVNSQLDLSVRRHFR